MTSKETYLYRLSCKVNNEKSFFRTFYGKCPDCESRIWSVDDSYDVESGNIRAMFICPCGKKYKQVVYSTHSKDGYRYPQGVVTTMSIHNQIKRVISSIDGVFYVTPDGIKHKSKK